MVWGCDVGKQAFGAAFAHLLNIIIAIYLASSEAGSDECAWYFINYAIDSFFGTLLAFILLKTFNAVFKQLDIPALYKSGEYGDPPDLCIWFGQFLVWICIIAIVKTVFLLVQLQIQDPLASLGDWLFGPVAAHPKLELCVVMVMCPFVFNAIQFWVSDMFLKARVQREHEPGDGSNKSVERYLGYEDQSKTEDLL